jgi:hypothetical protein
VSSGDVAEWASIELYQRAPFGVALTGSETQAHKQFGDPAARVGGRNAQHGRHLSFGPTLTGALGATRPLLGVGGQGGGEDLG